MTSKDREIFALALSVLDQATKANDIVSKTIAQLTLTALVNKYKQPISEIS